MKIEIGKVYKDNGKLLPECGIRILKIVDKHMSNQWDCWVYIYKLLKGKPTKPFINYFHEHSVLADNLERVSKIERALYE